MSHQPRGKRRQLTRQQRRILQHPQAAAAIRERKSAMPWRRACATVRQLVDAGELLPGCARVMDAMARCHEDHGAGVRDLELLIGYGLAGDKRRVEARKKARGELPRFDGIAEEAGITRRYAMTCVAMLVARGLLKRWFGGPNRDYRKNAKDILQRPNAAGDRRLCLQGIGGSGWANAYTVDGIEDPPPDEPPRPPEPPSPAPREPSHLGRAREQLQRIRDNLERDRVARQRRRLADEERVRVGQSRGP